MSFEFTLWQLGALAFVKFHPSLINVLNENLKKHEYLMNRKSTKINFKIMEIEFNKICLHVIFNSVNFLLQKSALIFFLRVFGIWFYLIQSYFGSISIPKSILIQFCFVNEIFVEYLKYWYLLKFKWICSRLSSCELCEVIFSIFWPYGGLFLQKGTRRK